MQTKNGTYLQFVSAIGGAENQAESSINGLVIEELEQRESFGVSTDCGCSCSCDCTSCSCIVRW